MEGLVSIPEESAADRLLKKAARLEDGKSLVEKAYALAGEQLKGREDKEKILEHSLRVAEKLLEFGFDSTTVATGILHDLGSFPEARNVDLAVGPEVASMVADLERIRQIELENTGNTEPGILSSIILASAKDIRTIFVKFASRIDVLEKPRGIAGRKPEELAKAALEIYAPMCQKLGLYEVQSQLEDNGLKTLEPETYREISVLLGKTAAERKKDAEWAGAELARLLRENGKKAVVQARAKGIYSIYKKGKTQGKKFEEIYDLIGVRAICGSVQECYEILGLVHSRYKTAPNKFSDYISNPKKNGYRSIHTVVLWQGKPLEVQIRTWEMHYECETGLAAHWQYKNYARDDFFDRRLSWAKQIVEWHRSLRDSKGLIHRLKMDFGKSRIFVFTPKHQVVVLPEDSTPIDFAFAIHSDLGNRCQRVKVNGKLVPLSQKLENSDVVEITPAGSIQVKRQWLAFVKTNKARTKIKQKLGISVLKKESTEKIKQETMSSDKNARIAKCCNPVPGDEIVGVRTTKRKISIHGAGCENAKNIPKDKLIGIKWGLAEKGYVVGLTIKARDSPQLLPSILNIIGKEKASIISTETRASKNNLLECGFNVRIRNIGQLNNLIEKIGGLPSVFEVARE